MSSLPNLQEFSCIAESIDVQGLVELPAGLRTLKVGVWENQEEVLLKFLALSAQQCPNLAELQIWRNQSEAVLRELAKFGR